MGRRKPVNRMLIEEPPNPSLAEGPLQIMQVPELVPKALVDVLAVLQPLDETDRERVLRSAAAYFQVKEIWTR
jgi:hypothetical protein